ncbi:oligosaccharide flippase family protein [Cellulophaga baltica]|uniref:oligosaccharide flippase family protein n=1 Tax=Cellulophaga TaxID=104264 RepID=UPI001C07E9B0|nr:MULTISPECIES: oligosaccharide flippase family protein [Cellulophaga]MBU2995969.1 oligosaccharide flippase family protein [Cellulophaga baltica]MDO6767364.1 oligosaccharide flippase family protein [Cellulophaga sp. 1_MG-2023]
MNFKNKSLILNFSGYTLINLFNSITPFIVLPILTLNLTPEDIGILDLFSTSAIFITPLIGLCFVQSISKLYYVFSDKKKYLSSLFSSVFLLGFFFIIASAVVLFLTKIFLIPENLKILILLIIIYVSLNIVIEGFLMLKRNEEKIKQFAIVRILKSLLEISLTVIFLYYIDDYMLRVLAIICSTSITFFYVLYLLINQSKISFEINKEVLKKIFIYSTPLIFHTLFASILNYADRYFIADILDVSQLGKYSVVYQLCMLLSLLINSFNMAWTPYFMKNMTSKKEEFLNKIPNLYKKYIIVLFAFSCVLFLIIPLIYKYYVGYDYIVDNKIYGVLILGYFFNGLYRFKVAYLFYYEKTISIAKLSFITAVINLILNYFLINEYGLLGAAFATLVSYLVLYLLLEKLLINNKNEKINNNVI